MDDTGVMAIVGIVIGSGVFGGLLNCLIFDHKLVLPYKEQAPVLAWNIGFLSNILLGIAASGIIWALGAHDLPWKRMLAMCLITAIGGGNFIQSLVQKSQIDLQSTKIDELSGIASKLAGQLPANIQERRTDEDSENYR